MEQQKIKKYINKFKGACVSKSCANKSSLYLRHLNFWYNKFVLAGGAPEVIGQGSFGCVVRPGLQCDKGTVEKSIAKIQINNSVAKEELVILKQIKIIDPFNIYYGNLISSCNFKTIDSESLKNDLVTKCKFDKSLEYIIYNMTDSGFSLYHVLTKKIDAMEKDKSDASKRPVVSSLSKSVINSIYSNFRDIVYHLLVGLKLLHDQHIVHRDIKLENMVIDSANILPYISSIAYNKYTKSPTLLCKYIDFGLAREITQYGIIFEETHSVLIKDKANRETIERIVFSIFRGNYQISLLEFIKHPEVEKDKQTIECFVRSKLNQTNTVYDLWSYLTMRIANAKNILISLITSGTYIYMPPEMYSMIIYLLGPEISDTLSKHILFQQTELTPKAIAQRGKQMICTPVPSKEFVSPKPFQQYKTFKSSKLFTDEDELESLIINISKFGDVLLRNFYSGKELIMGVDVFALGKTLVYLVDHIEFIHKKIIDPKMKFLLANMINFDPISRWSCTECIEYLNS